MSFQAPNKQPVNWIREHTCANGVVLRISDRTGIVQVKSSSGLGLQGYVDDFFHLFTAMTEVQAYLEKNQDVAFSSDASRESRKAKQVQQRNQARAMLTLQQIDPAILQAAIDALNKSKGA